MLKINTYSNKQPAFGSYRIQNNAHIYIAHEIHKVKDINTDTKFIEYIAKPLKKLTSEVIANGKKVIIEHPTLKQSYEVIDKIPVKHENGFAYYLKALNADDSKIFNYTICYPHNCDVGTIPNFNNFWYSEILRKHIYALELAKDFERHVTNKLAFPSSEIASGKVINETANKLKDLFG